MRTRGGLKRWRWRSSGLGEGGGIEAGFVGGEIGGGFVADGEVVRGVFSESCSSCGCGRTGGAASVCVGVDASSGTVSTFFNALPLLFLVFMAVSGLSTFRRRSCSSSLLLLVLPGRSLPTYAPLIMRSISVSPGFSSSRLRLRMLLPKTIARCSLLSLSFW